jgi:hypothetical protein
MSDWYNSPVMEPVRLFLERVLQFLPNVLLMLAVLIVGLVLARVTSWLLRRLLELASFDKFCQRSGLGEMLAKGGARQTPSRLVGKIVFYFLALVVFFMALSALNLQATTDLISSFFKYLPHLLLAVGIVAASYLLARFLHRSVLIAAVNANLKQAAIIARGVQGAILVLGFAVALEHLAIGRSIVLAAFSITFGGVVLALALAFGLAGKDLARDVLERNVKGREKEEQPDEMQHL